ncbi:oligopeptide transporter, OPT family [candidate division KSB1 bacterium]|nr:oligopeptide transporter, OPT family [candidate division KSB1 bacterium]
MTNHEKPYIPYDTKLPEFTLKAILLGILMAVILGAANAYLGMKAGMTIAATIPAAVIAIAAFRLPFFRGSVLEQNIARTTASVGEALVAGAIFTIPAFVIVEVGGQKLWKTFHYWDTTIILLAGGMLGILFVIILRRTLCIDAQLPFPESYACAEIVKAGQGGETGAKYVFGAMGVGVILQLLKDSQGFQIFKEYAGGFIKFPASVIHHFDPQRNPIGDVAHGGGLAFSSPVASPALISIGYIIGPRLAAINFSGGVFAWLILIPLALFLDPDLPSRLNLSGTMADWETVSYSVWYNIVRPIAVGAMLVGSLYTLYKMRESILNSVRGAFKKYSLSKEEGEFAPTRLDIDIPLKWIIIAIVILVLPITAIYYYFCHNFWGAVLAAIIMTLTGFLFSAVGGYLVGLVGGSNQPVSGLTLSALIVAALIMVLIGVTGLSGVAAVLGVAAVVCCATCTSGDMIQDLKVGHLLGGTPWKMEIAEIISTIVVSFVLVFPIMFLHEANIKMGGIGIGDKALPAPQAGLMAQLAKGIVGGEMPWGLILVGMMFSVGLIMIKAPSPMLIAVGMYLPFETTFSIFIGGAIKWVFDRMSKRRGLSDKDKERSASKGVLVASGFIAGEAITGILLAVLVLSNVPSITHILTGLEQLPFYENWGGWLSLIIFAVVIYGLIKIPIGREKT